MDEITEFDIEKIYSDMEEYLIKNIKRNLTNDLKSFHLKEEKDYGFNWEAWQTAKLRDLQKFRKQNKDIVNERTKGIDKKIAAVLNKEARQGKLSAYRGYKEALTHGYKSSVAVKDSFFKMNSKKVRSLINSVTNDFQKVNYATFRKSNDIYRQIIAEASVYNNTGVMTPQQAIRKAIKDFEARGINSIVYANGSRHKISEYASMAIRTASTRSQLMGEGELRKKLGITTIQMSKHSTACKLCQPWEGKVLIDDVYSGGSKKDGKYPLLSEAMKQGLYHPNCRHGHGTYFAELSKSTNQKIIDKVEKDEDKKVPILKNNKVELKHENNELHNIAINKDKKVIPMSDYDYKSLAYKLRDDGYLKKEILDTRRWGYDGEDLATKKLLYETKYNGLPQIYDESAFDNLGDDYIKVYRGVRNTEKITAKEINEQFRSGDLYIGNGIFGNGTYTAVNKEIANGYGTDILEIAIPKNARILDFEDIEKELVLDKTRREKGEKPINVKIGDFVDTGIKRGFLDDDYSEAIFTSEENRHLRSLLNDTTFKAVSCNYDVIKVSPERWYKVMTEEARKEVDRIGIKKEPYYVILNRGITIVKRGD